MVRIETKDSRINIYATYSHKDKCASVPGGRWDSRLRCWSYIQTPATLAEIRKVFGSEIPDEWKPYFNAAAKALDNVKAVKSGTYEYSLPMTNIPCWHHQLVGYNIGRELFNLECGGGTLMALDMGCGKSKVSVDLFSNLPFKSAIVVCPNSVVEVWVGEEDGELKKHSPVFEDMIVIPIKTGKGMRSIEKKAKAAELARYRAVTQNKRFVVVINYESVWREPFASWVVAANFDLVISDEIHRIKDPGGRTSKFFARLTSSVKRRIGLTGTPMPHSPLDIYAQYRFLDPGIFGTSFTKFRNEYANMGGFEGKQVLSFKNLDRLHEKMFQIAYRVMSNEVFDLPPFQDVTRTVDLEADERRIYEEMDSEMATLVKEGLVTVDNALVKLLRLQEITSGFLEGNQIGTSKQQLLDDVLQDFELHEPITIFARFTNDLRVIKKICEKQGRRYMELSGRIDQHVEWKQGKADVLGVQIKSGKEGVDFTRARYSIYYSLGFSLGDYDQSRKRLDRPGQTREGVYIHLLANKTVDLKVMRALKYRKAVISEVLNDYMNERGN